MTETSDLRNKLKPYLMTGPNSTTATPARSSERVAPSILLVEDDPELRSMIGRRLRLEGFDVDGVSCGEAGLVRFLTRRHENAAYDAAIIDVVMDSLDGTALLALLRQLDPGLTILMISGCGDLTVAVEALRRGADDFMGKPLKIWDLKDRIRTATASRKAILRRGAAPPDKGLGWGTRLGAERSPTYGTGDGSRDLATLGVTGALTRLLDEHGQDRKGSAAQVDPRAETKRKPLRPSHPGDPRLEEARTKGQVATDAHTERRSSPVDALRDLAAWVETRVGLDHAGVAAASTLAKLGAYLAGKLGLRPDELDALCLSAELQHLGRVPEFAAMAHTKDHPPSVSDALRLTAAIVRLLADNPATDQPTVCHIAESTLEIVATWRAHGKPQPERANERRLAILFEIVDQWLQGPTRENDTTHGTTEVPEDLARQLDDGELQVAQDALAALQRIEAQ